MSDRFAFRGWAIALVGLMALGCKPKSEPDFPFGEPPADYPMPAAPGSDPNALPPAPTTVSQNTEPAVSPSSVAALPDAGSAPQNDTSSDARVAPPDHPPAPDTTQLPPPIPAASDAGATAQAPDVAQPVAASDAGSTGTASSGTGDAGAADAGDGSTAPETPPRPRSTEPPALPEAWKVELARKVGRRARLKGRKHNRAGLKKHKAGDYVGAIEQYEQALAAHPQALYPRYNLACALALTGNHDEALRHLVALNRLEAQKKVADARTDKDFESLAADPRFRKVVQWATVRVVRANKVPRDSVGALAEMIRRDVKYPAQSTDTIAPPHERTAVYFRPGHNAAATSIASVLSEARRLRLPDDLAELAGESEILVVIARAEDLVASAERVLRDFYDLSLTGKSSLGSHDLRLASRGFYEETIHGELDDVIRRSGTFTIESDLIVLSFTETKETAAEVSRPRERSMKLEVSRTSRGFKLGGVRYRK